MEAQPGSSGFLGGYIVNELLGRGHEVIRIENFSKYGKATLLIELLSLKRGVAAGRRRDDSAASRRSQRAVHAGSKAANPELLGFGQLACFVIQRRRIPHDGILASKYEGLSFASSGEICSSGGRRELWEMFELIFFCRNGSERQRCRNCPHPRPGSIKAVLIDAARSEQKGAWPL
jgi:hypothetical protein